MPSAISSLFDRVALGRWLRTTLHEHEMTAFELDRLVPRRDAFWLRVFLEDEQRRRRPYHFKIAATDASHVGWRLGRRRCVPCRPEEDGKLAISEALDQEVRLRVEEMLDARVSRATISAYTPERRAVVCYELENGSTLYGKLHRSESFDRVLETAHLLTRVELEDCVVEPAATIADCRMVLWRGVEGTHLGAEYPGLRYERGLAAAGVALRRLHHATLELDVAIRLADEWRRAAEHLDRIAELLGRRPVALSRLGERLQALVGGIGEFQPRTLHGDYHDNQVLLSGPTARILDLDGVASGDPAVDVGNFLAHIDFRIAYSGRRDDAGRYARVFRASYGDVGGQDPDRRVLFGYAVSLFRNACLYILVPWRMRRLAGACSALLDSLERD